MLNLQHRQQNTPLSSLSLAEGDEQAHPSSPGIHVPLRVHPTLQNQIQSNWMLLLQTQNLMDQPYYKPLKILV